MTNKNSHCEGARDRGNLNRLLSIILAAILLIGVLPLTVSAEEVDSADTGAILSGTTGTAEFSVDDRGGKLGYSLTVDGKNTAYAQTGSYTVDNLNQLSNAPWMGYANQITKITVKGVKYIYSAFYSCKYNFSGRDSRLSDTGLTVSLDNCLEEIHSYAFANAHITSIDFEKCPKLTTIKNNAFANNDFETLNTAAQTFGDSAFEDCKNLKKVTFASAGTKTIGKNAFKGCTSINYVYWVGTPDEFYAAVDAQGGNDPLKNAATIVFSEKNKKEIPSNINLTVKEPIVDTAADYYLSLSNNSYCYIDTSTTYETGLDIMNQTTGQPADKYYFVSGNTYRYYVYLIGYSGTENGREYEYVFNQNTPVYINGKKATFFRNLDGKQSRAAFYVDFQPKNATHIDSVNLTITQPTAGAKPNFTVSKDSNLCDFYSGLGLVVQNGTGLEFIDLSKGTPENPLLDWQYYMTKDETFKAGQMYIARVFLEITDKPDTYFGGQMTAKINGKTAKVSDVSSGKETFCWIDYTFTAGSAGSGSTVSGSFTSYLNASGAVTVQLLQGTTVKYSTVAYGNTGSYSISNVANGSYTLRVSKTNHVTRDYDITVSGNKTQDVKIHPLGDISGDGKTTTRDFAMAYAHAQHSKGAELTGYALKCGDVIKNDGKVTTTDAARINAHVQKTDYLYQ